MDSGSEGQLVEPLVDFIRSRGASWEELLYKCFDHTDKSDPSVERFACAIKQGLLRTSDDSFLARANAAVFPLQNTSTSPSARDECIMQQSCAVHVASDQPLPEGSPNASAPAVIPRNLPVNRTASTSTAMKQTQHSHAYSGSNDTTQAPRNNTDKVPLDSRTHTVIQTNQNMLPVPQLGASDQIPSLVDHVELTKVLQASPRASGERDLTSARPPKNSTAATFEDCGAQSSSMGHENEEGSGSEERSLACTELAGGSNDEAEHNSGAAPVLTDALQSNTVHVASGTATAAGRLPDAIAVPEHGRKRAVLSGTENKVTCVSSVAHAEFDDRVALKPGKQVADMEVDNLPPHAGPRAAKLLDRHQHTGANPFSAVSSSAASMSQASLDTVLVPIANPPTANTCSPIPQPLDPNSTCNTAACGDRSHLLSLPGPRVHGDKPSSRSAPPLQASEATALQLRERVSFPDSPQGPSGHLKAHTPTHPVAPARRPTAQPLRLKIKRAPKEPNASPLHVNAPSPALHRNSLVGNASTTGHTCAKDQCQSNEPGAALLSKKRKSSRSLDPEKQKRFMARRDLGGRFSSSLSAKQPLYQPLRPLRLAPHAHSAPPGWHADTEDSIRDLELKIWPDSHAKAPAQADALTSNQGGVRPEMRISWTGHAVGGFAQPRPGLSDAGPSRGNDMGWIQALGLEPEDAFSHHRNEDTVAKRCDVGDGRPGSQGAAYAPPPADLRNNNHPSIGGACARPCEEIFWGQCDSCTGWRKISKEENVNIKQLPADEYWVCGRCEDNCECPCQSKPCKGRPDNSYDYTDFSYHGTAKIPFITKKSLIKNSLTYYPVYEVECPRAGCKKGNHTRACVPDKVGPLLKFMQDHREHIPNGGWDAKYNELNDWAQLNPDAQKRRNCVMPFVCCPIRRNEKPWGREWEKDGVKYLSPSLEQRLKHRVEMSAFRKDHPNLDVATDYNLAIEIAHQEYKDKEEYSRKKKERLRADRKAEAQEVAEDASGLHHAWPNFDDDVAYIGEGTNEDTLLQELAAWQSGQND